MAKAAQISFLVSFIIERQASEGHTSNTKKTASKMSELKGPLS